LTPSISNTPEVDRRIRAIADVLGIAREIVI
jgi:hypothetical protein